MREVERIVTIIRALESTLLNNLGGIHEEHCEGGFFQGVDQPIPLIGRLDPTAFPLARAPANQRGEYQTAGCILTPMIEPRLGTVYRLRATACWARSRDPELHWLPRSILPAL